jgi:hypothetical protein
LTVDNPVAGGAPAAEAAAWLSVFAPPDVVKVTAPTALRLRAVFATTELLARVNATAAPTPAVAPDVSPEALVEIGAVWVAVALRSPPRESVVVEVPIVAAVLTLESETPTEGASTVVGVPVAPVSASVVIA